MNCTIQGHSTNTIALFGYVQLLFFRDAGHISQADYIRLRNVWRTQWNCNTKQLEREAKAISKR